MSSDDDLQIFPSLAPDEPEPDFPAPGVESPSNSSGDTSDDDILLQGLPQKERDRVVSAWARLEEVETSYPGTLAICLTASARAHALASKRTVEAMGNLPQQIKESAEAVNLGAENNQQLIQEVSNTSKDLKDSASAQRDSQKYTEKMSRWTFALCLAGVVIFVLSLGSNVVSWVAAKNASEIVELAEETTKIQKLAAQRIVLLHADMQLRERWGELERRRQVEGDTEEIRGAQQRLVDANRNLQERLDKQRAREKELLADES